MLLDSGVVLIVPSCQWPAALAGLSMQAWHNNCNVLAYGHVSHVLRSMQNMLA